ncbi:MAG: metallophosphoesterase [Candidatus Pacearchaeota archaeon]
MKLLHISDIHGDLDSLNTVADFARKRNDLEVIVCTGDLLGQCLPEEKVRLMLQAHNDILKRVYINERPIQNVFEFKEVLSFLLQRGDKAAEVYRAIEQEFEKNAEIQYSTIREVLAKFPQKVLTIPGNWDSQQYFYHFEEFDIHKKIREVGEVEFGGYGVDLATPTFLPLTKIIPYSEDELYNFLVENIPEVAVTHTPPRGILDQTLQGNKGSWAVLAYLRNPEESSNLFLCGHCHESFGVIKPKGLRTLVINSGNLGKYKDCSHQRSFIEINYENGKEISILPYEIRPDGTINLIKREQ